MLRDVLTQEELRALLGDEAATPPANHTGSAGNHLGEDDRKLLHALVRNQLRQMRMIEELQAELRRLAASGDLPGPGRAERETAAGLEPMPLPFMNNAHPQLSEPHTSEPQEAPASEVSRKERFRRKSFW